MGKKPRVAFFDFACCEGCQLTVIQLEEGLLDVVRHVDIVAFREAMTEKSDDYDVAFVEGSITRPADIPRIEKIRGHAKVLVALGACATLGGVNCLKNRFPMEEAMEVVYGRDAKYFETFPARPVDAVVPVDYYIHGCPINPNEFLKVFHAILQGRPYPVPDRPVCVECRLKENVCLLEKGLTCMGPVTRAGCEALCPSHGYYCFGCRGLVSEPNRDSEARLLQAHGLTPEEVAGRFDIYTHGGYPERKGVAT
jgi:coenzyme F420-reducing hydrogenase gamma subunit